MERFEVSRVKDFKAIIIQYLENLMTHQQQVGDVYCYTMALQCIDLFSVTINLTSTF